MTGDNNLQQQAADEKSEAIAKALLQDKHQEMLENNPDEVVNLTNGAKRKQTDNAFEDEDGENRTNHSQGEKQKKQKLEELKCGECSFKCFNKAELSTHEVTTHGQKKRLKTWEMDFHCRSRGHKVKKTDNIPCKKCDYLAENK